MVLTLNCIYVYSNIFFILSILYLYGILNQFEYIFLCLPTNRTSTLCQREEISIRRCMDTRKIQHLFLILKKLFYFYVLPISYCAVVIKFRYTPNGTHYSYIHVSYLGSHDGDNKKYLDQCNISTCYFKGSKSLSNDDSHLAHLYV